MEIDLRDKAQDPIADEGGKSTAVHSHNILA